MTAASGRSGSHTARALRRLVVTLLMWWLWMPVGATLIWLVKHFLFGGFGQQDQGYTLFLQAELFPYGDPWHLAALMWLWLSVGALISIPIVAGFAVSDEFKRSRPARRTAVAVLVAVSLLAAFSVVGTWRAFWDNDKDLARFYLQDTTFVASSVSPPPSSLVPLVDGSRPGSGACAYVGAADVPSCIRIGSMPNFDWAPRTASFAAASNVMTNSSALASQVDVMAATEHYLPGSAGKPGVWSAVLDGSGTRSMEGVAEWDGQSNTATICQFQGDDSFDRAFGGFGGNSLGNLIAQRFPALVYVTSDITGYCAGSGPDARPVLVIPVERQTGWEQRTVLDPAGVLVVTGSPSGNPVLTYDATVRPGQFPCQVYPESVATTQVDDLVWAAGRGNMNDAGFGYWNAGIEANTSNPGEYVLRSTTDGHYYFVTPLTPRNSDSEAVVAYAVERADEASNGLNPLTVYVAADATDPPSLQVIQSQMTAYVNQVDPGLISSGGEGNLDEIIPFGRGMWRGFVDVDGVTQDYVDVAGDSTVPPSLVQLSGSGGASGQSPGTVDCGGNPATMSASQLAQCIQQFAAALNHQESGNPAPTTSSG
jgi:hypothetical protein